MDYANTMQIISILKKIAKELKRIADSMEAN